MVEARMMRAVRARGDAAGWPVVVDLPRPIVAAGEVLIRVRATAINRVDVLQLRGLYPPPAGETEIPGLECAGEVAIADPAGGGPPVGTRVMALLGGGGHAEYVAAPVGQLMRVPDALSWAEAAAVPESGLTAWTNLVVEGRLIAGEVVLISGASGGVGSFAVQVARELGAVVIGTARDPEQLRAMGLDGVVKAGPSVAEAVREITAGRGVDLVFDLVGGDQFEGHLASLGPQGRMVLIGLMAGAHADIDLSRILRRRLWVVGSVLRPRSRAEKARLVAAFEEFAGPRLADGRLRPRIHRVFPFELIGEAVGAVIAGGGVGKVVVEMAA